MEQLPKANESGRDVVEKFTTSDLWSLKSALEHAQDNTEAVDLVTSFLEGRGYGVDKEKLREITPGLRKQEIVEIQKKLAEVAWVQ